MIQQTPEEKQVVILMADMVHYSQISATMTPIEVYRFLARYHSNIHTALNDKNFEPLTIEPTGGDGTIITFYQRDNEELSGICTRAVEAAVRLASAINNGELVPTRMGLMLGTIVESYIYDKPVKCGACFAIANRLEELSGYFGTSFLMDREIVRNQRGYDDFIVNIGKVSLASVPHPINVFALYTPKSLMIPDSVDVDKLKEFIRKRNRAMAFFVGNQIKSVRPNFPFVQEQLFEVQEMYRKLTGSPDTAISRVLEYITEMPRPEASFADRGMELMEKKRDSLGERLVHLSKELLRAMNPEFYRVLIEDTTWEQYFKLEWFNKGDVIINLGDTPDGIYYLDFGQIMVFDEYYNHISTLDSGNIFGEMAYFAHKKRRTATVIATSDVVVRHVSPNDFEKIPTIVEIFKNIAKDRQQRSGTGRAK